MKDKMEPFNLATFAGGKLVADIDDGMSRCLRDIDGRIGGTGKVILEISVIMPDDAHLEAGDHLSIEGKVKVTTPARMGVSRRAWLREGVICTDIEETDNNGTRALPFKVNE